MREVMRRISASGRREDEGGEAPDLSTRLDAMWERAAKLGAADPRVELTERKTDDFKVLQLHSFYVRFLLPMRIEVQCYEWAPGFDDQRMA